MIDYFKCEHPLVQGNLLKKCSVIDRHFGRIGSKKVKKPSLKHKNVDKIFTVRVFDD